jgi:hypothetical protein
MRKFVTDAVIATFDTGLWVLVDWDEDSRTWCGEPLWFSREGSNLEVGLLSGEGHVRCLENLTPRHWERLVRGEGRWVEAGPRGLLCTHDIRLDAGPEGIKCFRPEEEDRFLSGYAAQYVASGSEVA